MSDDTGEEMELLKDALGRKNPLMDPSIRGKGSGWAQMSPEERSEYGRQLNQRRKDKERAAKEEQERVDALARATLTVEEFKEAFINPAAVLAWTRLWAHALEKNDQALFKWVVEHRIGKPGTKAEIEHSGGVTINIVRPPRGETIDGELVQDAELEQPAA